MAFEAHHFAGTRREPKRSWARTHRKEARAEASARVPGNVMAVLCNRTTELDAIRDEYRLVVYMDRHHVLSHDQFRHTGQRRYRILRALHGLADSGDIAMGQKGDFWPASELRPASVTSLLAGLLTA